MPEPQLGMVVILWKMSKRGSYTDQLGSRHEAYIFVQEVVCQICEVGGALLKVRSKSDPQTVFICNVHRWRTEPGQHWSVHGQMDHEYEYADAAWARSWAERGMVPCATSDGQLPPQPAYIEAVPTDRSVA